MFCSECGAKAMGKFCSHCGTRLVPADSQSEAPAETPLEVTDLVGDWSQVVQYQTLLRYPEVRDRIAEAASESTTSMTGEEFLKLCEKALTPLTQVPIPFTAIAKISQPLNASLGMKTGKQRAEFVPQPIGQVLVRVLCALARQGRKLKYVRQLEDGCHFKAELGSDLFALAGDLNVVVRLHGDGTLVEASTHIPGQLFDWGKSSRCLEQLINEARAAA